MCPVGHHDEHTEGRSETLEDWFLASACKTIYTGGVHRNTDMDVDGVAELVGHLCAGYRKKCNSKPHIRVEPQPSIWKEDDSRLRTVLVATVHPGGEEINHGITREPAA